MKLHALDVAIIIAYFITAITVGFWVSRRGAKDMDSYFLGGKTLPWYLLGISDASGMFDISGTMWLVYILFVYGLKSLWLPWVWPTFNQIFLMMFLSGWLRRSNVLTGAEWIQTRFGRGAGANLAHLSVVFFALVNVIGLLAYAFKGLGKFIVLLLPWHFDGVRDFAGGFLPASAVGLLSDENIYAILIMGVTSLYVIKGGMISVVTTEVMQFTILTVSALAIGCIAIYKVSPDMIQHLLPAGWTSPFFGWHLGLDWTGILDQVNNAIKSDGNDLFGALFGIMLFKGVLASLAGPAPNYDMQRILATRNPREACLMNGFVNVVLYFPRYLMIAGITVMALAFCMPELRAQSTPDFEKILPLVLFGQYLPVGVVGFLLAGLIAAFMSNFAATLNAAPAYVVNDIYKRYLNPASSGKADVRMSRLVSLLFLAIGILFGLITTSITEVMMWIVGALYGGYVMANVLKWYWWRFNGYGYFWGMISGILAAMVAPRLAKAILGHPVSNDLYLFPAILVVSVLGCILGALLTKPEDDETLKHFYKTVNPWGAWGPIRAKVMQEDPSFRPNVSMFRDCGNVAIGIVWQVSLTALPIYIVLREWTWAAALLATFIATSVVLKFTWYDQLENPARALQP